MKSGSSWVCRQTSSSLEDAATVTKTSTLTQPVIKDAINRDESRSGEQHPGSYHFPQNLIYLPSNEVCSPPGCWVHKNGAGEKIILVHIVVTFPDGRFEAADSVDQLMLTRERCGPASELWDLLSSAAVAGRLFVSWLISDICFLKHLMMF